MRVNFTDPADLWHHIEATLPRGGVVAISGFGGAGKTELGKALGRDKHGIQLIHGDDYLDWPLACQRQQNGEAVIFGSILRAHINPFRAGRKPVRWLIVESIQIFTEQRQRHFDYRIWVDTPIDQANANGQARDAQNQQLWDDILVPNDLDFDRAHHPRQYADATYTW